MAVLGAFLPLLPTTVFIILAAWAFANSSPEREAWLLNHRTFGPPLRNWRQHRAISVRVKYFAFGCITLSGIIAAWVLRTNPILLAVTMFCLAGVICYICRLPVLPDSAE